MAALPNQFVLFGWTVTVGKPETPRESRRAREFANRVYKQTKGPTPELKRLYAKLQENERRTRAG